MNSLLKALWDSFAAERLNKSEELERLQKSLFLKLSAATTEEFTWKICDLCDKTADFAARKAFRRGLCLGGQLVLAMLSEGLDPPDGFAASPLSKGAKGPNVTRPPYASQSFRDQRK